MRDVAHIVCWFGVKMCYQFSQGKKWTEVAEMYEVLAVYIFYTKEAAVEMLNERTDLTSARLQSIALSLIFL